MDSIITSFATAVLRPLAVVAAMALAPSSYAQQYPTKPIRLIVPFAPGGPTDSISRAVAHQMSGTLGQPIVVENKPGADATIGTDLVAKSPADGYTLLFTTSSLAITASLYPKLPFTLRDFAHIGLIGTQYLVLVTHPSMGAPTLESFISLVKARPSDYNYGAAGSTITLVTELFHNRAGLVGGTRVPYRGNAPMLNGLFTGELQYGFLSMDSAVPHILAGKLKALAVTSPRRATSMPDIPTTSEAGVRDAASGVWYSMQAPRGTPAAIVTKLNLALNAAIASPSVIETSQRFPGFFLSPTTTPAATEEFVHSEAERWAPFVKSAGLTPG